MLGSSNKHKILRPNRGFVQIPLIIVGVFVLVGVLIIGATNLRTNVLTGPKITSLGSSPGTVPVVSAITIVTASSSMSNGNFAKLRKTSKTAPDLTSDISYLDRKKVRAGTTFTIRGLIVNRGGVSATSTMARLRIDVGDNGSWDIVKETPVSNLRQNSRKAIVWKRVWRAISGRHRVELCADIRNSVVELKDANNCEAIVLKVK